MADKFTNAREIARKLAVAGHGDQAYRINEIIMFGVNSSNEQQKLTATMMDILLHTRHISNDLQQDLRRFVG